MSDVIEGSDRLEDGIVIIGHNKNHRGDMLGFTSDKFSQESYLWIKDGCVYISFIHSLKRGCFRSLVERILSLGYVVRIPTPIGRMHDIVMKNGYERKYDPACSVEYWEKQPATPRVSS